MAEAEFELPDGYFKPTGQNEVTLVSTVDDPPKFRLGKKISDLWGRALGCLSFNNVRADGSEDELVLIQGKETETFWNGEKNGGGELWVGFKEPNGGSDDSSMLTGLVANWSGWHFHQPIYAPNLGPGAVAPEFNFNMKHPNGIIWMTMQGDGNLVLYKNKVAFDYNTGVPYWSTGTVVVQGG
jgi:hypothetical protein